MLTAEEAADVLCIGRTTVYALMKEGRLRPVHIGRSCRITRAELERFVRRLDTPPTTAQQPSASRGRPLVDQPALFTAPTGLPAAGC
ncbi:helix-turn-helix domain-containing protein [Geodermatophilaceae bacterium NBWT11]|nr:helix-turn-helix domain-containing protein [Geodermatophilaceae bacterium NBWT11]